METAFSQLQPVALSNRIALLIEEAIMNGSIKPGERLNTDKLAREFNVSHIPVREALKRLEVVGLVVMEPNKGASVVELSEDDVSQIFLVRKALEGLAVNLAASRSDRARQKQLQALVDKMSEASKSKDFIAMFEADKKFHQTIWEMTGNRFLAKALNNLLLPYFGYVATKGYFQNRTKIDYVPSVHQKVLDAISSGDGDSAQQVIVEVHNRSMHLMLKGMARSPLKKQSTP